MGTVIDYLKKYGDYSFRDMPMTEVDSLALCQLAYLKFDGMVPGLRDGQPSVPLVSLTEHPDFERLFADKRYERINRELLKGMLAGRRFGSLKLNCYVNIIVQKWETQFSAVTFVLDDGTAYVAYRGTDESIVGWKEDFNMAFLSPVPGQEMSVDYLDTAAGRIRGSFCVGGHSKGGNLAIYSAMNCKRETQDRITKIFSLDGPGFRPETLEKGKYDLIADRVAKILPHSSLVGMLFESNMNFQVVESMTFGLLQHNPYTWKVEDAHLVCADALYERRKQMDNTLNEWILSLDERQLRIFVDTLFQVISASEADNLIDFTAEWRRSMNGIVGALKGIDEETALILKKTVKGLFDIAGANMKREVASKTEATLSLLGGRQKPAKQNRIELSARKA